MNENGFKDATIEQVHYGLLEALAFSAHKISFPELAIPALAQLRAFLKKCKIANYTKKMKTIKEKIEENAKFVLAKRSKVAFGVRDLDQIAAFEAQLKVAQERPPLAKYFDTVKSVKEAEKAKKLKKEMDDYKFIPEMKNKTKAKPVEEFKGIFGDEEEEDDEDEMDDVERFQLREERKGKKRGMDKVQQPSSESEDESSDDNDSDSEDTEEQPQSKKAKRDAEEESSDEEEDDEVQDFDNFSDDD